VPAVCAQSPLVDSVRGRIGEANGRHDRNPGQPLAKHSTVLTTARPTHDSHLTLVGGRPAAASAMLIKESTPGYAQHRGPWPVLVSVRYLDGAFLAELGERNLLTDPRFSRSSALLEGEQEMLLRNEHGTALGYLIWKPDLPGSSILGTLAPATGILALFMAALMSLLARRLFKTTNELAAAEAESAQMALQDSLTGLPNRALFSARLSELLLRAANPPTTLLLIDLDRFKQVNDTLGHPAGDALLIEFGARLGRLAGPGDTIARLGGDEFAILATARTRREVEELCQSVLASASRTFLLEGGTAFVGASIGIAVASRRGCIPAELIRQADVALYAAKGDGRGCVRFFSPEMGAAVHERALLEEDLRAAIARNDLAVWYQPQVARSGAVVGVEALLRWSHPTRGVVGPDAFVQVAEEAGLIIELGDWVMREAAAAAERWPDLSIAVNVSPVQLRQAGMAERTTAIFAAAGIDPRRIELEVTERILLDANRFVLDEIARLRAAGFQLVLDDFGTGYSSLSYLQRFPVSKIKIDRSFVARLSHETESHAIVAAILNLGRALGLAVTAEGVETSGQLALLIAGGCTEFQGHRFAAACPAGQIDDLLQDGGLVRGLAAAMPLAELRKAAS
jgi:diguanylate cyclase (GGDEF)-like protein